MHQIKTYRKTDLPLKPAVDGADMWAVGLEKAMLFELEARSRGIDTLLANISSHNQPSIAFHKKQGFRECGRFERINRKFGRDVDIIWMQKFI